jgi:hypothetical protein
MIFYIIIIIIKMNENRTYKEKMKDYHD